MATPPPPPSRALRTLLLGVTGTGVLLCGGVAWWWPREASVTFEGSAPVVATARVPIDVMRPVVLDQHGDPLEEQPTVHLSLEPEGRAVLEAGRLMPVARGPVEVVATTDDGTRSGYTVTLDLPVDYAGRWVSEARQGDVTVTTYVVATRKGGDVYDNVTQVVFARGSGAAEEVRTYALRNHVTVTRGASGAGDRVCEDNPILIPPDAPFSAIQQCSRVVQEQADAIVLDSPEGGTFTLARPTASAWQPLHRIVQRDLERMRDAQRGWKAKFGTYLPVGLEARARAELAKGVWRWNPDSNLVMMQWAPTPHVVNAAYWATATANDYTLHAILDADGDGTPGEYMATPTRGVERVSGSDVW
jgi:hypothetical protein